MTAKMAVSWIPREKNPESVQADRDQTQYPIFVNHTHSVRNQTYRKWTGLSLRVNDGWLVRWFQGRWRRSKRGFRNGFCFFIFIIQSEVENVIIYHEIDLCYIQSLHFRNPLFRLVWVLEMVKREESERKRASLFCFSYWASDTNEALLDGNEYMWTFHIFGFAFWKFLKKKKRRKVGKRAV